MDRVAIYLRKSRKDIEAEERGEGETLSKHRKALLTIAKEQGLNIVKIRQEIASGESLVQRPEMMELLKEVEDGNYDAVLCMDVDRLGRGNMQEQGLILDTFRRSGTKIITPRKTYDLQDEWDEEYSEFEAFMARKELKIITRRLQRGIEHSLKEGNYIASTPPYGYRIKRDEHGCILVPEPSEAEVVRMIFRWYTHSNPEKRMGSTKIAAKLNEMGIKTQKGRAWQNNYIVSILKKSVYAGYIQYRKIEITRLKHGRKKSRQRPKDEWVEVKGRHEAIIDIDTYKKAQDFLASKYHPPHKGKISNPLAGIIKCGECGWSMIVKYSKSGNKKLPYIDCRNINCNNKSVRFEHVEARVLDVLKEWLEGYRLKWDPANQPEDDSKSEIKMREHAIQKLQKELSTLDQQRERLHDLLERGIYDDETFMERSATLASRISDTKTAIKKAQQELDEVKKRIKAKTQIIPQVEHVLELYPEVGEPKLKNALLKSILDKVEYTKKGHQKGSQFTLDLFPKLEQKKIWS